MGRTFSKPELMKFIRISDERTIDNYIDKGVISKPLRINSSEHWPQIEILQRLGLKVIPNETFMLPHEACEYLDVSTSTLSAYVKGKSVPHYSLLNCKGVRTLFLKSELEKYVELKIHWDNAWGNDAWRVMFISEVIENLFDIDLIKETNKESTEIAMSVLLGRKSCVDIAKSLGVTTSHVRFKADRWFEMISREIKELNKSRKALKEIVNENIKLKNELRHYKDNHTIKINDIHIAVTSKIKTDRVYNFLKKAEIETVEQLAEYKISDIIKFRNVGARSIADMTEMLISKGLYWKQEN